MIATEERTVVFTTPEERAEQERARRRIRETEIAAADRAAKTLWGREAFFEEVPAADGMARPTRCPGAPAVGGHLLLWVTQSVAICSGGGCPKHVWERVEDKHVRLGYRMRIVTEPVSRSLALALFVQRSADVEYACSEESSDGTRVA
jgi:hypothetical protein